MNVRKLKIGYIVGVVILLTMLACSGIGRAVKEAPAVRQAETNNPAATVVPVKAESETTVSKSGDTTTAPSGTFDPGGALTGADSYALTIDATQGKVTFKGIKSKKEYQVISSGQGASTEMYIKNDTLYTVTAGNCVGVAMKPSDIDSLTRLGDFTTFTTGLGEEKLVGEEEINGTKTNHYQAAGSGGSVDIWAAQEGGYLVRLAGQGPAGQVQIDVTDVNTLDEITLPEACANAITLPNFQ